MAFFVQLYADTALRENTPAYKIQVLAGPGSVSVCRGRRSLLGVFSITLPLFVRHCLSLQLELADLARTAGKETPDIHLSLSPQFWGYRCTTVPRVFMSILEAQRQALVFQWQVLCQLSTPVFYK